MSKALEKAGMLQARRLVKAAAVQKRVIDEFDSRYAQYVFGQPFFESDDAREAYYKRQGGGSDAQRIKQGWDTTTIPLHGMMRSVMMPYLISNDPVWINRQRKGATAMEMAKVDLFADTSTCIWTESQTTHEVQRAIDDAFMYRMGWCKTVYDPRLGLPRHCWVDARDMLIDCDTRSPKLEDRRWVAEKMTLPLETAQWFAESVWGAKKYNFTTVKFEEADLDNQPGREVRGGRSRDSADEDEGSDFVRIVMVQVKGENPWTMSSNLKSKRMNDPAGKDDVYDGKDYVLVMEAAAGYTDAKSYKVIARIDEWPFPCKPGRFTYTPFVLTKDNRNVYPNSIMQPAHSAQVATDVLIQAHNTDAILSARRWIAYSPENFQDPKDAETIAEGDSALLMAPVKNNADPRTAFASGNFGSPNQHIAMTAAMMREQYEGIAGMNKFDVQVRANQTAANSMIQNESAQVKVDDLSQLVERSVIELAEKGIMCARANMTLEDLNHWINVPKEVGGEEVQRSAMGRDLAAVVTNDLWTDKPDWDEIRREVEVNLEPRSIRFNNPEKEAQAITEIQKYQTDIARIIGDTVAKGGVAAAQEIARTANETIKMLATLKNIANYERLLFDFEKIMAPVAPPVSGDAALGAQMENAKMQGEINAQQQAAFTRMQNQGVSPDGFPQAVQG